jgi:hypothetical protein
MLRRYRENLKTTREEYMRKPIIVVVSIGVLRLHTQGRRAQ